MSHVPLSGERVYHKFRIGPVVFLISLALPFVAGECRVARKGTPAISMSQDSMDFGIRPLGPGKSVGTIWLANTGSGPLTLGRFAITEGNTGDFSLKQNCPKTLSAGATCLLNPTFSPTAPGRRHALIRVEDNAGRLVQTAILTGIGSSLSLSRRSLLFGKSPQTLTVTNRGTGSVSLGQVRTAGADAGDFSNTSACEAKLKTGSECIVTVRYVSAAMEVRTASLLFSDTSCDCTQAVSMMGARGQFMALSADKTYLVNAITNKPVFMTGNKRTASPPTSPVTRMSSITFRFGKPWDLMQYGSELPI